MLKIATFAAAASVAALIAGSAGAADLRVFSPTTPAVHVSVASKSAAQIDADIHAAADTVCKGADGSCVETAISDADAQLRAINRANRVASGPANVEVARANPSTIRVSLKGKSRAAIEAEIKSAANTVCKSTSTNGAEFGVCVSEAISDAKSQLQFIAQGEGGRELAAN